MRRLVAVGERNKAVCAGRQFGPGLRAKRGLPNVIYSPREHPNGSGHSELMATAPGVVFNATEVLPISLHDRTAGSSK